MSMKHYDGPAFYRRKGISRKPVSKPVNEMTTEQVRDTQEKPSRHVLDSNFWLTKITKTMKRLLFWRKSKTLNHKSVQNPKNVSSKLKRITFSANRIDVIGYTMSWRVSWDLHMMIWFWLHPIKTKSKMMLFIQQMIILMRKLTLINRHKNH